MPYVAVSDEDREALEILAKRDDLTEWEEDFLQALHSRHLWTDRQKEKFDELWKRKMGA
jgi:hypothetical protein